MPVRTEEIEMIIDKLTNPRSGLTTSLEENALSIIKKLNEDLTKLNEDMRLLQEELDMINKATVEGEEDFDDVFGF